MSIRRTIAAAAGALMALSAASLGCASAPVPPELQNARRAYQQAAASPASTTAPAELLTAKQALTRAESAFENEPDSQRTRDLAYVAERRAQWAESMGKTGYARRQVEQARRDYETGLAQRQQQQAEEIARAQQQRAADQQRLAQTEAQAAADRQARLAAEQRAREAVQRLGKVGTVREEQQRGTVITLSGSVLFASGRSNLLPIARQRLDQVAEALKQQPSDVPLVVEGYTDSMGAAAANEELSLRRAQAVRDYLISKGVAAEHIQAVGRGDASPVATNATAEGRANNRRVEIVIGHAAMVGATGTTGQGTTGQGTTGQGTTGQGTTGQGTTGQGTTQGTGTTRGTGHGATTHGGTSHGTKDKGTKGQTPKKGGTPGSQGGAPPPQPQP